MSSRVVSFGWHFEWFCWWKGDDRDWHWIDERSRVDDWDSDNLEYAWDCHWPSRSRIVDVVIQMNDSITRFRGIIFHSRLCHFETMPVSLSCRNDRKRKKREFRRNMTQTPYDEAAVNHYSVGSDNLRSRLIFVDEGSAQNQPSIKWPSRIIQKTLER
jgi:hypothetical protein